MAGVSLGVFALVVVISVMNGFNDQIQKRLLAVEPHLVARVAGVESISALKDHPVYTYLMSNKKAQTEIFENQDVILRTSDGLFGGALAKGIESSALGYILRETQKSQIPNKTTVETPPISEESTKLGPGEILVGIDLARGLGIFEGDHVTVIPPEALLLPAGEAPPFERVLVKGLLTTNIPDIDSKVVFYGRGQTFLSFRKSPSREAGYEVRLPNPNHYADVKAEIEKRGGKVETWIDRNSSLFYALRLEKMAMGTFLALSALIASFSIVTVLVLLITQKRKDIGLIMSLGLSAHQTRVLFVRVGLILSSVGIGTGLVLGIVACILLDNFPITALPDIYYDATIPAKLDPYFVLGILVVAGVIAFLSAWIPVRNTTHAMPADALRGAGRA
jgi:lipoprotein-releasing system permease protein